MEPPFAEMTKVRVTNQEHGEIEGYVIGSLFRDGRWLYKLSLPDGDETFDNWYPADWLKRVA